MSNQCQFAIIRGIAIHSFMLFGFAPRLEKSEMGSFIHTHTQGVSRFFFLVMVITISNCDAIFRAVLVERPSCQVPASALFTFEF
jgi:hypothetical protein